jgi:hypothetical protein
LSQFQKPGSVIPAEAGIQNLRTFWTPASAGVTGGVNFEIDSIGFHFSK